MRDASLMIKASSLPSIFLNSMCNDLFFAVFLKLCTLFDHERLHAQDNFRS